jgi:hypothetical protein
MITGEDTSVEFERKVGSDERVVQSSPVAEILPRKERWLRGILVAHRPRSS